MLAIAIGPIASCDGWRRFLKTMGVDMEVKLLKVVTENPYVAEVVVTEKSVETILNIFADWYCGNDQSKDRLENAFQFAYQSRDVSYWLELWGFRLVAVQLEQAVTPAIQKALSGKPALSTLFYRLSYLRWETIDESDERNLQRLSEILLSQRIEIERPRGERKARLKKLSN